MLDDALLTDALQGRRSTGYRSQGDSPALRFQRQLSLFTAGPETRETEVGGHVCVLSKGLGRACSRGPMH